MTAEGQPLHPFFRFVHRKVDEQRSWHDLGTGGIVRSWTVSGGFGKWRRPFAGRRLCGSRWLPFAGELEEVAWDAPGWTPFRHEGGFVARFTPALPESEVTYAAFAVDAPRTLRIAARFYNKRNLEIWHDGRLVFVSKKDLKQIDELLVLELHQGRNYLVLQKESTSILFTMSELERELASMGEYLSAEFVQGACRRIDVVPEAFFHDRPSFQAVLVPRDAASTATQRVEVSEGGSGRRIAELVCAPLEPFQVELPVGSCGVYSLEVLDDGSGSGGRQRVYCGDVPGTLARLRAAAAELGDGRPERDLRAWVGELEDVWTREETAAYEPRLTFEEEVNAFLDGLDRVERALALRAAGGDWRGALASGLLVHTYRSRLDGTEQSYFTFVPRDYRPDRPHALVVMLKYLYKRVQIPGFAFDGPLAAAANAIPTLVASPMGRGLNRYEVAGEVELVEMLRDMKERYRIDPGRVFLAGFSMGGGAAFTFAQKYPDLCTGVVGWSCNLVPEYLPNLEGTRVTYLTGALDGMFDYSRNKAALAGLAERCEPKQIDARTIAGAHHFSFFHLYDDLQLVRWAAAGPAAGATRPVRLHTDHLRYRRCAWLELVEPERPGSACDVEAEVRGGRAVIRTDQVRMLRIDAPALHEEYGVTAVELDGVVFSVGAGAPAWFERRAGGAWGPSGPLDDPATCGAGLAEVFYGPLRIVCGSESHSAIDRGLRRIARAWAHPKYYGEFREQYAQIEVLQAEEVDGALEGNLVLLGSAASNRLARALRAQPRIEQILHEVRARAGALQALVVKTPAFAPGACAVQIDVQDDSVLERYRDLSVLRAQFAPPFSGEKDLMSRDAVVLSREGVRSFSFDARWRIAGERFEPAAAAGDVR